MELSRRIKEYREENNLTQTDLAEKLFVTKQTISKWETGKGLPDISLYPTLASMLGVTVDELMGKEVDKKEDKQPKSKSIKMILLSVIPSSIIILVLLLICVILLITKAPQLVIKLYHINQTEQFIGTKLPKIVEYKYKSFDELSFINSSQFPQYLYYFIFDGDIVFIDNTFKSDLPDNVKEYLPSVAIEYIEKADYVKLINKDTKAINEIPNPFDDRFDRYVLYCYEEKTKRLIAINFEI